MAFTANILITAWASIHVLLENHQKTLSRQTEELGKNEFIEEEVSIGDVRAVLTWTKHIRQWLWWGGVGSGVVFAAFLYYLIWEVSPDTLVCGAWFQRSLSLAAYTCPILMGLMTIVGLSGNWWVDRQTKKLQKVATRKQTIREEKTEQVRASIRRTHQPLKWDDDN